MRIFVTGATGFIGSAIVRELQAAGHEVLGLARDAAAMEKLQQEGVAGHSGDLSDPDSLVAGARECDGVIHTAFIHDFSAHAAAIDTDRRAIEALAEALRNSNKPFVSTSGTALLAPGRTSIEQDLPPQDHAVSTRGAAEAILLEAAKHGVRTSIGRLPPTVHGAGDHGFVPRLVDIARTTGVAAYIGDGSNRWPAVHRLDAARLFCLGLAKAAPGTHLHAVAEEGIPMREIASAIGEGLGIPVRSITMDEAPAHFDWLARFVAIDSPSSCAVTRDIMGWHPREIGLLADMRENGYFA